MSIILNGYEVNFIVDTIQEFKKLGIKEFELVLNGDGNYFLEFELVLNGDGNHFLNSISDKNNKHVLPIPIRPIEYIEIKPTIVSNTNFMELFNDRQ